MQIEVNKKQFKEMLIGAMLYSWVYGGLADSKGQDFQKFEELENFLLQIAEQEELTDLYEQFEGALVPSDELSEAMDEIIDEYDDDNFWDELINRLSRRDFHKTVTDEEIIEMEKTQWLPDRIRDFHEKYQKEFEENGIDKLEIK